MPYTYINQRIYAFLVTAFIAGCGGTAGEGGITDTSFIPDINNLAQEDIVQNDNNPGISINRAPTAIISADPVSGLASLTVNVDATQSTDDGEISSYRWSYGDGSFSSSPTDAHVYNQPGSYDLSLTVTDNDGLETTASTTVHVFTSVDNSQVVVPNGVTFYDNFEYSVDRNGDASGGYDTFVNQGGWHHVKGENMPNNSGKGFLYTVSQIPGYNGAFPGSNSNTVLAMESRPVALANAGQDSTQTDYYLQFGQGNIDDEVPANVWFQFWIYPNRYDDPTNQNDQLSVFENRFKFIYPCAGGYPCQDGNIKWLTTLGFTTGEPFWANQDQNELFITTLDPYATEMNYDLAPPYDAHKLGQTNISENITPNRWTLVKIHLDTSTQSGVYEAWLKPMGGNWVKVAEWIDGVTPNFSWRLNEIGGHRMFRMPTTVDDHDSWIYMDDFAVATSEADLPVYPY